MGRKIEWTPEMDEFIRNNYKTKSDRAISKMIGYSKASVSKRRIELGLVKSTAISKDIIDYAVNLVAQGSNYSQAVRECNKKFNTEISVCMLIRCCRKVNVESVRGFKREPVKIETYDTLQVYNLKLNKLKQSLKINDEIEVTGNGTMKVVEKYPNFVVCMVNGFRESVLYTDIKRIVN